MGNLIDDSITSNPPLNPAARLTDDYSMTVTVFNEPPNFVGSPTSFIKQAGKSFSFTLTVTDAHKDPIAVSASGLPTGASFDPGTLTFNWTTPIAGNYTITFTAQDYFMDSQGSMHLGMASNHQIKLTIDGQAPTATITSPNSCTTSTLPEFQASVSDNIALANATVTLYLRSNRGLTSIFVRDVTLSGTGAAISGIKPSSSLKRGGYRYAITLRDTAGNISQPYYKDFTVAISCK